MTIATPLMPVARMVVGITGHRGTNRAIPDDGQRITEILRAIFASIDESVAIETGNAAGPTRLHTLLAHGVDQMAATAAAERGWEIVAPLPFGRTVNVAVNAQPHTREDARALLDATEAADRTVQARAAGIRRWSDRVRSFELADRDEEVAALLVAMLDDPADIDRVKLYRAATSAQAALAGRVMIEQSDLLIAVWDGEVRDQVGGTGHTVVTALEMGTPVLLLDPGEPETWTILSALEALAGLQARKGQDDAALRAIVGGALTSRDGKRGLTQQDGRWRARSSRVSTLYRRIEAVFGGEARPLRSLTQCYEAPDAIATGSAAPLLAAARAMPGADRTFVDAVATRILPTFAWADGISAWLSDAYRSGMIANFLLSACAIIVGIAYLPLGLTDGKRAFAIVEFVLLASILIITWLGGRRRLHARWFETRRAAEYLRHAPILLLIGVARPASRWPRGALSAHCQTRSDQAHMRVGPSTAVRTARSPNRSPLRRSRCTCPCLSRCEDRAV